MNYYEHHIGDYIEATAHLTFIEHGAYGSLLRKYYATESALPPALSDIYRLILCRSSAEKKATERVLREFFVLKEDGWHQERCDQEIQRFRSKSDIGRANANARWRNATASNLHMQTPCKTDATAADLHRSGNALQSQSPDTNNQKDTPPTPSRGRVRGNGRSRPEYIRAKTADELEREEAARAGQ